MGGRGTGAWQEAQFRTVGALLRLDVRALVRALQAAAETAPAAPARATVPTIAARALELVTAVRRETSAAEGWRVALSYEWRTPAGTRVDMGASLCLTATHHGRRWWANCPGLHGGAPCARRVAVLYREVAGDFACRHCHQLRYASQRETPAGRLRRIADQLAAQLRARPFSPGLTRPPAMSPPRYERLLARAGEAEARSLLEDLGACDRQLEREAPDIWAQVRHLVPPPQPIATTKKDEGARR